MNEEMVTVEECIESMIAAEEADMKESKARGDAMAVQESESVIAAMKESISAENLDTTQASIKAILGGCKGVRLER